MNKFSSVPSPFLLFIDVNSYDLKEPKNTNHDRVKAKLYIVFPKAIKCIYTF